MKRRVLVFVVFAAGCAGVEARDEGLSTSRASLTISTPFSISNPPVSGLSDQARTTMGYVPTSAGALMYHAETVGGRTMLMVHQHDATGAMVPGTLRGLRATVGTFPPDRGWSFARAYGAGVMFAWVVPSGAGASAGSVLMQRVDLTGRPIDATPLVALASGSGFTLRDVACNASQCLLALTSGTRLAFRRVAIGGGVLDATPVELSASITEYQSLAALDDRFIIGWTETPPVSTLDLRVARIGLDGRVLDAGGRAITVAGGARSRLSFATEGTRLFAQWFAVAQGPRPDAAYTAVFDRDLNPITPTTAHADLFTLGLAPFWDGTQWVLGTWQYTVRFDRDGTRLDATPNRVASMMYSYPRWLSGAPGAMVFWGSSLERYDSQGRVLPSATFEASHASDARPAIDFNGTEYAVAWMRNNAATLVSRVTSAGVVRDNPGAPLGRVGEYERMIASPVVIALEGSSAHLFGTVPYYGASHATLDMTTRVRAPIENYQMGEVTYYTGVVRGRGQAILTSPYQLRRLAPTTWNRLDPAPILISSSTLAGSHADFDGTNYLVGFEALVGGAFSLYVRRLGPEGDFIDAPRSLSSLGGVRAGPWLAYGAGTHLIAWVDQVHQVRATRLALDGTPATGTPLVLGVTMPPSGGTWVYDSHEVSLVFDGTDFVVAWTTLGDPTVRAARVTPAGVLRDTTPLALADGATIATSRVALVAASDGRGNTLVAYDGADYDQGATEVRGVFLRNDGASPTDAGVDASVDGGADASVDVARDVTVDVASDASVDVARDVSVDVASDVSVDVASDVSVDVASDVTIDVASDVSVDVASDVVFDAARDSAVDVARDAVDASVEDVAVADVTTADVAVDASAPPPAPADDGGCSVRAGTSGKQGSGAWAALPIAAVFARRKRRRAEAQRT